MKGFDDLPAGLKVVMAFTGNLETQEVECVKKPPEDLIRDLNIPEWATEPEEIYFTITIFGMPVKYFQTEAEMNIYLNKLFPGSERVKSGPTTQSMLLGIEQLNIIITFFRTLTEQSLEIREGAIRAAGDLIGAKAEFIGDVPYKEREARHIPDWLTDTDQIFYMIQVKGLPIWYFETDTELDEFMIEHFPFAKRRAIT